MLRKLLQIKVLDFIERIFLKLFFSVAHPHLRDINDRDFINSTDNVDMKKRKALLSRGCQLESFLQSERRWDYR